MYIAKQKVRKVFASLLVVLLLALSTVGLSFAADKQLVFVGDSRTCYMHSAVTGSQYLPELLVSDSTGLWSATQGCQYSWMQNVLVPRMELLLKDGARVVFWMGVNDVLNGNSNAKTYASYYNQKAAEWKARGIKVYVMNVGPKGSNKSINTTFQADNTKIRKFNKTLKKNLSSDIVYLDVYNHISDSFSTPDDLHYSDNTSKRIYKWVVKQVK